ncbi:MAG: DUF362 domain-containing protein [Candidatus Methanosuratincola sp.]
MKYRVAVVDFAGDYDSAVNKLLASLEWKPEVGSSYLLKPNMLNAKSAEEGVTTDPKIVSAMIRVLKGRGCRACVGDSPGNAYPGKSKAVFESTGMMKEILEAGGEFLDFEGHPPVIEQIGGELVASVPFSKHIQEHRIINIPKLKTHVQTVMTGAVKNLSFGCIQGASKSKLHTLGNTSEKMAKVIIDVYSHIRERVDLNLMDAIVCMDGNGPSFGRVRRASKILAGRDALALDMVSFRMAGIDPLCVPYIREGVRRGMGPSSEDEIEVIGGPLPNYEFKIPSTILRDISLRFGSVVKRFVPRISFDESRCVKCGECAGICPEGAISMVGYPVVDDSKCIRCYACYEVCEYNAVKIKQKALPI